MTLRRKDAIATALVGAAVLVFAIAEPQWWVALAVLALGVAAYGVDARGDRFPGLKRLVVIAALAIALTAVAMATAGPVPLALLVALVAGCWLITTGRHVAGLR